MTLISDEKHFKTVGDPDLDRVVIVIPGGPGLGFGYLLPYLTDLSKHFQVVFYNPGFTSNFQNVSLEILTRELNLIAKRFADKNLGFIAHSGGSILLLNYFKRFLEKPSAFVSWIVDIDWLEMFEKKNVRAQKVSQSLKTEISATKSEEDILRLRTLAFIEDYFTPAFHSIGRQILNSIDYFLIISTLVEEHLNGGVSYREEFRRLGLAIGIGGSEDRVIFPDYLLALCNRQSNVDLHLIQNAGHFPFIEKPKEFSRLITNFFNRIFNRDSDA